MKIPRFIAGLLIGAAITILGHPELTSQRTTHDTVPVPGTGTIINVKVVAADRDAGTVTLLCPMVHQVELTVEAGPDDFVRLREGEFYRARLVPGQMNTTRRSMIIVEPDSEEPTEVKIQRVTLR